MYSLIRFGDLQFVFSYVVESCLWNIWHFVLVWWADLQLLALFVYSFLVIFVRMTVNFLHDGGLVPVYQLTLQYVQCWLCRVRPPEYPDTGTGNKWIDPLIFIFIPHAFFLISLNRCSMSLRWYARSRLLHLPRSFKNIYHRYSMPIICIPCSRYIWLFSR